MNLIPIEYQNERILTTEQLARVYGTESRRISENFNRNADKFIEGKHYFKLEGDALRTFKNDYANCVSVKINSLYLWTKRGASRHCKMLGTDKAWEQFDILEDNYFNQSPNLLASNLSPQLQVLIKLELKQKEQEQQIAEVNQRVDDIRDVVALSPNDWRKDTARLINKMALSMGGYEHVKPIRTESYRLLDERMGVDLNCRLTNKRRRMADEGVCKSKRDKVNQLDVIADDKKLIEGYVAIIKEMSIKYGVAA